MARPLVLVQGGGVVIAGGPEPVPPPEPETYPPGAVAAWPLNEAGGTRYDLASINHLTDFGSVGMSEDGALFDGTQKTLYRAAGLDNIDNSIGEYDWYISLQYKPAVGVSESGVQGLVGRWFNAPEYVMYVDSGALKFALTPGGLQSITLGTPTPEAWNTICVWYDSGNSLMGGQLNAETPVTAVCGGPLTPTVEQFEVGSYAGAGQNCNGIIRRLTIFKGSCTSERRALLYSSGAGLAFPTPGLKFACLGDSKTRGAGDSLFRRGYIQALRSLIGGRIVGVLGAAPPAQAVTLATLIDAWIPTVTHAPDVILLNIGTNDLDNVVSDPPENEELWKTQVRYVLSACRTAWPAVEFYQAFPWKPDFDAQSALLQVWINELIAENPSWHHPGPDEQIDLRGSDNGASELSDSVHPTDPTYVNIVAPSWATSLGL